MGVIRTYEPGEKPAIRGYVTHAELSLWHGSHLAGSATVDREHIPLQPNNLNDWFRAAYKVLGAPMRPMLGLHLENMDIRVNGGIGPKLGRGCHDNTFEFIHSVNGVMEYKLLIRVFSVAHSVRSNQRAARGDPPRPRRDFSKVTYIEQGGKYVKQYDEALGTHLVWPIEEYWEKFPHHKGMLPIKGVPGATK